MFGAIKREKTLARLLAAAIDKKELVKLAPKLALSPLPGRRLKTMTPAEHALLLARKLLDPSSPPKVVQAVSGALPRPLFASSESAEPDRWLALGPADVPLETRVRYLLFALRDPANAERVGAAIDAGWLDDSEAVQDEAPESTPDSTGLERAPDTSELARRASAAEAQRDAAVASRDELRKESSERIAEAKREIAELQKRLGQKNQDAAKSEQLVRELKSDLELAFRKAAQHKRDLDQTRAPSVREAELEERLRAAERRADIEASKVELLEYQLDLLEQPDEKERAPPPPKADDPLPGRVAEFVKKHGRAPRILVLGGAGKQRSHLEKDFAGLKERLGVEGEWRLADYTSWHRELPRLKNDLRVRFDLLFVLHWNRTNFVQKMHDEARAAGTRARTVSYRGFLSLERAVREEIDRFVTEKS